MARLIINAGGRDISYNYRCSKQGCRQRKTLAHPMEWYLWKRKPKCPACKEDSLKFDGATRRATMRRTCKCGSVAWPHRIGTMSTKWGVCDSVPYGVADKFMEQP
jgi:hypothetical protein